MSQKHVTLLIESSTTWGTEIIRGIADYAHANADWLIYFEPRGKYELLELPQSWNGDGVIARVTHKKLAQQVIDCGAPVVNVSWHDFAAGLIPRCTANERLAGELIATHFLERAFRNFAYCGPRRRGKSVDLFGAAFVKILEDAGFECEQFLDETGLMGGAPTRSELDRLSEWIARLPKPIALLAYSDVRGRQVAEACRLAGVAVPDEVALMGGEHDKLSCEVSHPKLSSIDLAPFQIGWNAAHLLHRLMDGEAPPNEPVLIPPARVAVRQSTDTLAIDDRVVRDALRFISDNVSKPINVRHILEAVPTSRRVLELKFRTLLGRSPGEEIRRARIERAKMLLVETDLPLSAIAGKCGFLYAEVLTRLFRSVVGMTPSAYRQQVHPTSTNRTAE